MAELTHEQAVSLLDMTHDFFHTNMTRPINFRINQLKRLKTSIKTYECQLIDALYKDLRKSSTESYMTEIGYVYKSIQDMIKNIKKWAKPTTVKTPYYMLPSKSYIINEPYGTVLIIGPFNYPFQLVMEPLIGALAAGNCAVVKPSELTPNVSRVIAKIIKKAFPKEYVSCVLGAVPTNTALLHAGFDYIFFTGSPSIGKVVMKAASKKLIPVTLELGGKSPVIVDKTANIKLAARRIIWGKTLNGGQTCIAPDYLFVHKEVKDKLILEMKRVLVRYYGKNPKNSASYTRIVNERHMKRLSGIIDSEKEHIIHGGGYDHNTFFIEPTFIEANSFSQPCMQEELFGPILPVMTFEHIKDVIKEINAHEKPLALYIFSKDKTVQKKLIHATTSGGACINDVISHIVNPHLPFGGVGNSGIGSYHSKESFLTFSHRKSVFANKGNISNALSEPPYSTLQEKVIRMVFR